MKGHLESSRSSWIVFIIVFFTYAIISMTKNTYSTAIATIVDQQLFSRANAGIINSGFYLFYSFAQLFGGVLVDKFSPFKIMLFGLSGAIITNAVMAVTASYHVMLIAWSLNGLFQFGIWPAVLKLITTVVMPEHRQKAMSYLFFAYPLGTILSYLVAASLLCFFNWPSLFWSSVIILSVNTMFVLSLMHHLKRKTLPYTEETEANIAPVSVETKENKETATKSARFFPMLVSSGLLFLTIPALIRCMLDFGLKHWVPTMIMECYGVSPSFANLLTTILIIVNLSGIFFVNWLYPKRCKNVATVFGLFFLVSVPFLVIIVFMDKLHLFYIILSLALTTTFMMAGSQVINVIMPAAFAKQKKTGLICGFINAFGSLGVMLANYFYGWLADYFNWTITAIIWLILGVISVIFCFMATPLWKRFTAENTV